MTKEEIDELALQLASALSAIDHHRAFMKRDQEGLEYHQREIKSRQRKIDELETKAEKCRDSLLAQSKGT